MNTAAIFFGVAIRKDAALTDECTLCINAGSAGAAQVANGTNQILVLCERGERYLTMDSVPAAHEFEALQCEMCARKILISAAPPYTPMPPAHMRAWH
jgi:hypothetical protein